MMGMEKKIMMKIGKKMINKLENKILLNKIYLSNIYFLFHFFRRWTIFNFNNFYEKYKNNKV